MFFSIYLSLSPFFLSFPSICLSCYLCVPVCVCVYVDVMNGSDGRERMMTLCILSFYLP
jgi:predicted molibdopterin-dependent oxidoreductase YjgC